MELCQIILVNVCIFLCFNRRMRYRKVSVLEWENAVWMKIHFNIKFHVVIIHYQTHSLHLLAQSEIPETNAMIIVAEDIKYTLESYAFGGVFSKVW